MPPAKQPAAGLTDTWGRANRRLEDRMCPACGAAFRPLKAASRFCSRPCMWTKNGGQNRKPETWWLNGRGYIEGRVWVDGVQIHVKRHRWIMERHIGRKLLPEEDVHHKDGNRQNNDLTNLEVIDHREHSALHSPDRPSPRGRKLNLTAEQRDARAAMMRKIRHPTRGQLTAHKAILIAKRIRIKPIRPGASGDAKYAPSPQTAVPEQGKHRMSRRDPQSPTDAADFEEDDPDAICPECGDFMDAMDINVEAFEKTGRKLCRSCGDEELGEDDGCCPGCGACPGFTGAECDGDCDWAIEDARANP